MDNNYTQNTPYAGFAPLGAWMKKEGIWEAVAEDVHIRQKTVKHSPIEKLQDVFIHILTGEQRMVTMNTRLRENEELQRIFGRETCVEQSLASTTLDCCDEETVVQLAGVLKDLLRRHGRCYSHNYKAQWQVLDIDMTGLLAGKQCEGSEKGYFANKRGAHGRQVGRVLATNYEEIVYEQLYSGRAHLESHLQELLQGAVDVLGLTKTRRRRTVLRIDGGGGSDAFINEVLEDGFAIVIKIHNWKRSQKLARSVEKWHVDPRDDGREVGWVTDPHAYFCPTRQLAVRKRNKQGRWVYSVLVTNLSPQALRWLSQQPAERELPAGDKTMWAFLCAYDRRGGGVETSIRQSKQALGLNKRNKRSFIAQTMLLLLAQLAQNTLIWFRQAMATINDKWLKYGLRRLIRDFLTMTGTLEIDPSGHICSIGFKRRNYLTRLWHDTVPLLLPSDDLSVYLYEI
jgi:hypothetical protein